MSGKVSQRITVPSFNLTMTPLTLVQQVHKSTTIFFSFIHTLARCIAVQKQPILRSHIHQGEKTPTKKEQATAMQPLHPQKETETGYTL